MADPPAGFVAVVDDDQRVLGSLGLLLESADHEVRLFTSGTEFLESGCLPEIDCLISDIDMPGMDGFELLRLLRGARPGLPAILITAYPETLERMPAIFSPAPLLFTKPFQGPKLLAAIGEALHKPAA